MNIKSTVFMVITVILTTSCVYPQRYEKARNQILSDCELDKANGVYKSYYEQVEKCESPKIIEAAKRNGYSDTTVLYARYAKKAALAEKLDRKLITKAEMKDELAQYDLDISKITDDNRQAGLGAMNGLITGLPQYNNATRPVRPINCTTNAINGTAHTTCN
jgi:hypothetical protein